MKLTTSAFLTLIILTSCWDTPRVDTAAVRDEMQSRKITYATQGDLASKAQEYGSSLLADYLSGAISMDSIFKMKNVELIQISEENLKSAVAIETQVFEAYKYSYEQGQLAGENIQYDKNTGIYYITIPEIKDSVFKMWSLRLSEKAVIMN